MTGAEIPRYRPSFRQTEVALIRAAAARGQSVCFVGVAGIGKTNLIHFLRYTGAGNPAMRSEPLGCSSPTWTAASGRRRPNRCGTSCSTASPAATTCPLLPGRAGEALTDEARVRQQLFNCVAQTCRDPQNRLMFLLDDFDDLLKHGPLEMLEALNTLRGECRDHLGYLIFTKRLPHVLGRAHDLETASKFYQLFERRIFALPLLAPEDARQMLARLDFIDGGGLSRPELGRIAFLAGGHSSLLRAVYEARRELGPLTDASVPALVAHASVRAAAQRLFRSLHLAEQEAAVRLAQSRLRPDDLDLIEHLGTRGLLVSLNSAAWFSPVWAHYLRECAGEDMQP